MIKLLLIPLLMLFTLSSCSTYEHMYDYSEPVYDETYTTHDPVVTTTNSHYVITYRMSNTPWQRPWNSMWYYDRPYSGYNYNYTSWGYNYNPCSYWSPFMPGYNPYWNPYNGYYPYYNSGYNTWGNNNWGNNNWGNQQPTWYGHRQNMGVFSTHRFYRNKDMTRTKIEKAPVRLVDKVNVDTRTRTVNTYYNRPTQKISSRDRYQQPSRTVTPNTNRYQQPNKSSRPTYNSGNSHSKQKAPRNK